MPIKHTVTVVLPGDESDDCMNHQFNSYTAALDFAMLCAESIDKDGWDNAIINNDGRVTAALNDWNKNQDEAAVTISIGFDKKAILAACRGESDWFKHKD